MQLRRVVITGWGHFTAWSNGGKHPGKLCSRGKYRVKSMRLMWKTWPARLLRSMMHIWFPARNLCQRRKFRDSSVSFILALPLQLRLESAKLDGLSEEERLRAGVDGLGHRGFERIATTHALLEKKGPRRISPFLFRRSW